MAIGNDKLTESNMVSIGLFAYFGIAVFTALIGLTVYNIVQFLIGQSRWKVIPVLIFYTMALCDLCYRIVAIIGLLYERKFFAIYFPAIAKLVIGYTQCWTILELTIRIK